MVGGLAGLAVGRWGDIALRMLGGFSGDMIDLSFGVDRTWFDHKLVMIKFASLFCKVKDMVSRSIYRFFEGFVVGTVFFFPMS